MFAKTNICRRSNENFIVIFHHFEGMEFSIFVQGQCMKTLFVPIYIPRNTENITRINKYREDINTTNTDRNEGMNLQYIEQKELLALTSTPLVCMSCPVALRYIQNAFQML